MIIPDGARCGTCGNPINPRDYVCKRDKVYCSLPCLKNDEGEGKTQNNEASEFVTEWHIKSATN